MLRNELLAGRISRDSAMDALSAAVDRELEPYERRNGVDADGHPLMPDSAVEAIRLAHSVVAGEPVALLSDETARYLEFTRPRVTAGTLNMKTRHLEECKRVATASIS